MKKLINILMAFASIMLSACTESVPFTPSGGDSEDTVAISCPQSSVRTSLYDDCPRWSNGDQVWICDGANSCKSSVSYNFDGLSTSLFPVSGIKLENVLFALYPYDGNAAVDDNENLSLRIPLVQEGRYAKANVMVGRSSKGQGDTIRLNCVSSLLKFSLDDERIEAIQMHTPGNYVAGTFKVNPSNGICVDVLNGFQDVALDLSGALEDGTGYIGTNAITLPVGTRFTFLKGEYVGHTVIARQIALEPGIIKDLGSIDHAAQFGGQLPVDLSQNESANCYVVNKSGNYRFKAVRGNSSESVCAAGQAEVLWETINTSAAPESQSLVADVICHRGYVYFSVPEGAPDGNALVAVRDASGKILWSWHIWVMSSDVEDCNLGALSETGMDGKSLGLLYQWGRKDPFPGLVSSEMSAPIAMSGVQMAGVQYRSISDNVNYSVSHPSAFIYGNDNGWTDGMEAGTLWQSAPLSKTVWDPCPAGYQIAGASFFHAMDESSISLYPCAGKIGGEDGVHKLETTGHYWLGNDGFSFGNVFDTAFGPEYVNPSNAYPVRCCKRSEPVRIPSVVFVFSTDDANLSFPYIRLGDGDKASIIWTSGSASPVSDKFVGFLFQSPGIYDVTLEASSLRTFELKSLRGISEIDRSGM